MTVYHGTYCEINSPKIIKGKYTKDFGTGFYCTVLKEQAEKWAKRYDTPIVCAYEYKPNPSLNILEFKYPTHQINFCTDEAVKYLTYINSEEVSK